MAGCERKVRASVLPSEVFASSECGAHVLQRAGVVAGVMLYILVLDII